MDRSSCYVGDKVYPERLTTGRITDSNRKELKVIRNLKKTCNIIYKKITPELKEIILDLRLTKRFGCNRIKFRLRKIVGFSLNTRTRLRIPIIRDLH
jgi:hypothetical protein